MFLFTYKKRRLKTDLHLKSAQLQLYQINLLATFYAYSAHCVIKSGQADGLISIG